MSSLLLILLSAILVCHYAPSVLQTRLFEETDEDANVLGVAIASSIAIALIAPLSYLIEHAVLQRFGVSYLQAFVLAMMIMTLAPLVAAAMRRFGCWTPVRRALTLVLIGNPAVFGTALLATSMSSLATAIVSGIGIGVGFAVLSLTFSALQARVAAAPIAPAFRGAPVALITVGLMALALMGLTGLIRD